MNDTGHTHERIGTFIGCPGCAPLLPGLRPDDRPAVPAATTPHLPDCVALNLADLLCWVDEHGVPDCVRDVRQAELDAYAEAAGPLTEDEIIALISTPADQLTDEQAARERLLVAGLDAATSTPEGPTMIVYVSVCSDDRTDHLVRAHTDPAAARAAVEQWAESKIDDGDPVEYDEHPGDELMLVVTIGEGTAYEGRYEASVFAAQVQS